MYAVFVEVDGSESLDDQAREIIRETVVPAVREAGARAGYWLSTHGDRAVAVITFDSEDAARQLAGQLIPGQPTEVPGCTYRSVQVSEVLATL